MYKEGDCCITLLSFERSVVFFTKYLTSKSEILSTMNFKLNITLARNIGMAYKANEHSLTMYLQM